MRLETRKQVKKQHAAWGLIVIMVVLAGAAVYFVKGIMSDDSPRKKDTTTIVTLMKPPPQIKEKPPEPEIKQIPRKEEIITQSPLDASESKGPDKDNTPAGESLGVDAEGTAGGDAFGLVGRKGGRSLLAGGGGGGGGMGRLSLLTKYAGYNNSLQTEIYKKVMKRAEEQGWFPKGKLQTGVQIRLDNNGAIVAFKIVGSSGNHKWDDLIDQVLHNGNVKLTPPPEELMNKTIVIRISCQG